MHFASHTRVHRHDDLARTSSGAQFTVGWCIVHRNFDSGKSVRIGSEFLPPCRELQLTRALDERPKRPIGVLVVSWTSGT